MAQLPEGFEGYILSETSIESINKAYGFEGVIIEPGSPFELSFPLSLEGIVFSYSDDTVFIDVVNGLGRPIAGCTVTGEFNTEERTGITNAQGRVILELDATTTLLIQKDHYSITYDYDRSTDFATPLVVFQPHMLE